MAYEVWVFSRGEQFKRSGGIVTIETAPDTFGLADTHAYASQLKDTYNHEGLDVSVLVRSDRSY
jgi:hypothetical protein